MTTIAIDGLSEEEFRRSIESGLRRGRAGEAVAKLRELIEPFAGPGRILPERFLTVDTSDLTLRGWEELGDRIRRFDRPGRLVSAISIAFGWPGEDVPQPDSEGRLSPLVEVGYYNDDAFPFSRSGREDLLDGYSLHGCTWGDDCVATDTALVLEGISDLHGALARLEAHLLASEEPDPDEICAGSLGACLLSALLYQAVSEKVAEAGLPRPLCVMAGSNGVYPYFDAPVAGMPVEVLKAAKAEDDDPTGLDTGVPGPRYSSLLMTGIRRAPKRAVLVLEESEEEMAVRIANLRGLAHGQQDAAAAAAPVPAADAPPEPTSATDGIIDSPMSPLMIKKPAGQGWDFRDMLSPRDPDSPAPPLDFDDWDEPLPDPQSDAAADPGPGPEIETTDAIADETGSDRSDDGFYHVFDDTGDTGDTFDDAFELTEQFSEPVDQPDDAILAEPGFSLVEGSLHERLQSLLAGSLEPAAPRTETAAESGDHSVPEQPAPLAVEPPAPTIPAAELAGPVWPFGIGWLEDAESEEPFSPALVPTFADADPIETDPLPVEPEVVLASRGPGLWTRMRTFFAAMRRPPRPERSRKIGR